MSDGGSFKFVTAGISALFLDMGIIFRRNRRLRSDVRRLPSIRTWYFRLGSTQVIKPVLCHLLGRLPAWFWICTLSPVFSGINSLPVLGPDRRALFARAISLAFAISSHSRRSFRSQRGRWSRMGRPNNIIAGEIPMSCVGVLRWVIMATQQHPYPTYPSLH